MGVEISRSVDVSACRTGLNKHFEYKRLHSQETNFLSSMRLQGFYPVQELSRPDVLSGAWQNSAFLLSEKIGKMKGGLHIGSIAPYV